MIKIFKVMWPDKYGPNWLTKETLDACLFSKAHTDKGEDLTVMDVTHLVEIKGDLND